MPAQTSNSLCKNTSILCKKEISVSVRGIAKNAVDPARPITCCLYLHTFCPKNRSYAFRNGVHISQAWKYYFSPPPGTSTSSFGRKTSNMLNCTAAFRFSSLREKSVGQQVWHNTRFPRLLPSPGRARLCWQDAPGGLSVFTAIFLIVSNKT